MSGEWDLGVGSWRLFVVGIARVPGPGPRTRKIVSRLSQDVFSTQVRPRSPPEAPRAAQDNPQRTQERPKTTAGGPRATQDFPQRTQERRKTDPGMHAHGCFGAPDRFSARAKLFFGLGHSPGSLPRPRPPPESPNSQKLTIPDTSQKLTISINKQNRKQ